MTYEGGTMTTPDGIRYTVASNGALPSAVRPRIERSIEQALNGDQFTTNQKRFGKRITTRKTRIA